MSETMSSPTDWPQFYPQNLSNQEMSNRVRVLSSDQSVFGDQGSDTTVVSTTITSNSGPSSLGLGQGSSSGGGGGGHLSPEGRVGKPVRRRSRASRRTPTTLLNTDTANFRAMVQQFTGGPSAPFAAAGAHPGGGPNFGFGFGGRQPHVNPNSLMIPPAGFQLQYQQQQQLIQHQNLPYMFSLNSNNNQGAGDLFLQRLGGNPRPNMEAGAGSEGFVVEGVSSQVPLSRTTTSSNENRGNPTFMF